MAPSVTFDSLECKSLNISHLNPSRAGVIITDGYLDNEGIIEFWDDFMGSNGSTDTTVPGYPWSLAGSSAGVTIKPKAYWGGIWSLMTNMTGHYTESNHEMNLFAGQSFLIKKGKSIHFKARFMVRNIDVPSSEGYDYSSAKNEGFFIGLTNLTDGTHSFIEDDCAGITARDDTSSYGLLMLSSVYGGEYSVLGVNYDNTIDSGYSHSDDDKGKQGVQWSETPNGEDGVVAGNGYSAGNGTGYYQGIVFEMNINCDNLASDSFTISYILTHEAGVSGGAHDGNSRIIKTGEISTAPDPDEGITDAFKYEQQKIMSPAVCMKSKSPDKNSEWYIDYIHCVQKR